jgi:hypothetical protein
MQARPDPPALALPRWEPSLALERLPPPPAPPVVVAQEKEEPDWLGRLEFADEPAPPAPPPPPPPEEPAKKRQTTAASKRRPPIGGSLLKADGTSEPSMVGML